MKRVLLILHRWLGLLSGLIVFIVCFTGALYAFHEEITDLSEPWRRVAPDRDLLPLSRLVTIANKAAGRTAPSAVTTGEAGDACWVDYFQEDGGRTTVFLNPHSGAVLHVERLAADEFDFFGFVLNGHKYLWLPPAVGRYVVGYGILVFVIVLVTGVAFRWPKHWNRRQLRQLLTFPNPAANSRQWFYALHLVLGNYALVFLLWASLTGMVFALDWWSGAVYAVASGGNQPKPYAMPQALAKSSELKLTKLDTLYAVTHRESPRAVQFYYSLPATDSDVYRVSVVHERQSYYRTDNLYYDPASLTELTGQGPWAGRYRKASAADKLLRMTLDLHDGRIFGLAGKILMFIASLIGASLPVTGLVLYIKRRKR